MRRFQDLLKRFQSDERGAFLVIFGLLALVLIAASGAVVDFTSIEQARTRAQTSLDAASLGLQPTIYTTGVTAATIKPKAQAVLTERLAQNGGTWTVCASASTPPPCASVDTVTINTTEGSLKLEATIRVGTAFVSLVGIPTIQAKLISEATRKRLNLEVAMVLDNSNSMDDHSRMTKLKSAATCAVGVLLNGACNSTATNGTTPNVKVAIVPFTMQVNVGTGNASATWMDRTGSMSGSITRNNFDTDDNEATAFTGPIDRIALFNNIGNVSWGGCVEARISPYDTRDDLPVAGTATMFTPLFAPDEPDSGYNNDYFADQPSACRRPVTWTWTQTKTSCNKNGNNSQSNYDTASCNATVTNAYAQTNEWGAAVSPAATTQPANQSAASYYNDANCNDDYNSNKTSSSPDRWTNTRTRSCTYYFTQRELQERTCKYTGNASSLSQASARGPNADCPTNAILPLTDSKPLVTAAIAALSPQGGTNIHAGTIWGFHVLSPTEPFTQGRTYDQATSKVAIVMTDGENTAYPTGNMNNTTYYSFYGFPWNARMGTASSTESQLEGEMNTRLLATCNNMKAVGITVYTIGLAVSSTSAPAVNTQLLKDCSSGTGYWYFPSDSDNLTAVFEEIASQLANLRLAQ